MTALPHLDETLASTSRYLATVDRLSHVELREPSLLPGWTRAHVVTHVARNADGFANLLTWARTGVESPQYASQEARDRDIELGASRSAAELAADAHESAARWEEAARQLPEDRLEHGVARLPGAERWPVRRVGVSRWTEVEVHHADLAAGHGPEDLPAGLVDHLLRRRRRELEAAGRPLLLRLTDADAVVEVGSGGPEVSGPSYAVVWWLLGRGAGEGLACSEPRLPELGRWA